MAHPGYETSVDKLVKILNKRRVYNYFITTIKKNHYQDRPEIECPSSVLKAYTNSKKRRDWITVMYPWYLTKQGYEFWEMIDMEWKTAIGAVDRGRL